MLIEMPWFERFQNSYKNTSGTMWWTQVVGDLLALQLPRNTTKYHWYIQRFCCWRLGTGYESRTCGVLNVKALVILLRRLSTKPKPASTYLNIFVHQLVRSLRDTDGQKHLRHYLASCLEPCHLPAARYRKASFRRSTKKTERGLTFTVSFSSICSMLIPVEPANERSQPHLLRSVLLRHVVTFLGRDL